MGFECCKYGGVVFKLLNKYFVSLTELYTGTAESFVYSFLQGCIVQFEQIRIDITNASSLVIDIIECLFYQPVKIYYRNIGICIQFIRVIEVTTPGLIIQFVYLLMKRNRPGIDARA